MALSSPGVQVSVIDESFYTPAEPGTVPLIVVATAENKQNGGGTGIAPGTQVANDGTVYLLTSQKDLADTFGDPVFKTDSNNNPIHAGEQNEYGLQAAYSLLGVSNRAFVVRANVDLDQLNASAEAPSANPANGTYWLDTQTTSFGIFEWNDAPANAGGQMFVKKTPIVITDTNKIDGDMPKNSVGAIGDYAVDATQTPVSIFHKNTTGDWAKVGSDNWAANLPVGTVTVAGKIDGSTSFKCNDTTINLNGPWTGSDIATQISAINGLDATFSSGKVTLYITDTAISQIIITQNPVAETGFTNNQTFIAPKLAIAKHTAVPQWKHSSQNPTVAPTGSVWIKTTEPNNGARWRVKRFNAGTALWQAVEAPIYTTASAALKALDNIGGGINLAVGTLFTKANATEVTPNEADFNIYRRKSSGATTVTSAIITDTTLDGNEGYTFTIKESIAGNDMMSDAATINFTSDNTGTGKGIVDAERVAGAINSAGLVNVQASVDSQNRVVITHTKGGEIAFKDTYWGAHSSFLVASGLAASANMYQAPTAAADPYVASLWEPLSYTAGMDAPMALATNGTLWYSSVIDEIDILIHNGSNWVGYQYDGSDGAIDASPYAGITDPNGPIVAATKPMENSMGDPLMTGDLWIDTSDIENFPTIYKYNKDLMTWVLVDKTDQSTEDGVLFHDARAGASGGSPTMAPESSIVELLSSAYLDPDAPDPALYPQGMLLWNLRRSGFNVKKLVRNYVDTAGDNTRYDPDLSGGVAMENYYPHRWVTESANQADGSGTFGRKAQRAVVVQALQATVNTNQQIRDEESRVFNLIACPGYPELIGELISLNYDRGLTAFVVGDTPARLHADATSLLAWGNNLNGALEDNDIGATSFDEYMGMFYPWGYTSDNFGNNVAVPPSHMILRTIALNDQVAYPWFAPAGVRRGGITNATAVGYISSEGEFKSVALNNGQRDTLYESKINPITFLTGTGLVNYGQKTRARAASSLDRINVARLVCYLRRQLSALAKPYIFEPNDKVTRDQIKNAVDGLMLELVGQRALYDYVCVCDESNNTPSRVDRNELWIDIAIEPVKAIEFIYIPLRLKNTGEIAALG
jgi:hypothetical protein